MRLLIREYLASLRERDELDAVLPDLLSEMGYTVLSRPSRGTRQFGVDVAAIGPTGDERLYLFSIKRGDLTRAEWDGDSRHALRPSLNEIKDVYIPVHVPQEHRARRIVICLCFGGDVHEQVRPNVTNYQRENETERVSYAEWNGDRIAGYIETGLLREGLLTKTMQSSFRKAVAMLDEPDVSFAHFSALVGALVAVNLTKRVAVGEKSRCAAPLASGVSNPRSVHGPSGVSPAAARIWPHDAPKPLGSGVSSQSTEVMTARLVSAKPMTSPGGPAPETTGLSPPAFSISS